MINNQFKSSINFALGEKGGIWKSLKKEEKVEGHRQPPSRSSWMRVRDQFQKENDRDHAGKATHLQGEMGKVLGGDLQGMTRQSRKRFTKADIAAVRKRVNKRGCRNFLGTKLKQKEKLQKRTGGVEKGLRN